MINSKKETNFNQAGTIKINLKLNPNTINYLILTFLLIFLCFVVFLIAVNLTCFKYGPIIVYVDVCITS